MLYSLSFIERNILQSNFTVPPGCICALIKITIFSSIRMNMLFEYFLSVLGIIKMY